MKPFTAHWPALTNRLRGRGDKAKYIEWLITLTCGIGNMLFGYDQGVMGGFLNSDPFKRAFPSISNGDATLQGFTVAVYEIGCAVGAFTVIFWGDRLGRRVTVMLGQAILIVGAILQFTSYSLAQLIVARVVTGVGNGMAVAVLPTWNGETSAEGVRGKAIMFQININIFGIALAYWVDYAVGQSPSTAQTDWAWRFPLSLQVLFAATTIALSLFLPDSPRALVRKGQIDDARDVLDMLSRETDPERREESVRETLAMIETSLNEELAIATGWTDVLSQGPSRNRQRLILAVAALCSLQITGINLITYYAPTLFLSLGFSNKLSLLIAGFNGLEYWLATFIPIPLIDRLGRRPLMLFAGTGQTICMAVLAATVAYPESKPAGYCATAFLFLFNTFFAVGFVGIPFLLPVELTPLATRGKSVAVATGCFWLCNFLIVMVSPLMIKNIKYGTYIVWTATNAAMVPLYYFLLPETLNAALEDIDVLFEQEQRWLIGPGSRRKLAAIVAARKEREGMEMERRRVTGGKGRAGAPERVYGEAPPAAEVVDVREDEGKAT